MRVCVCAAKGKGGTLGDWGGLQIEGDNVREEFRERRGRARPLLEVPVPERARHREAPRHALRAPGPQRAHLGNAKTRIAPIVSKN